ncbi:hypothetical protein L228DRAFT_249534 [Xylona heveae TC161]|uniref:Uncharacterized protein n=1 Tax=Xylona heveae (strain CBS 132557 / TC161) TaxID=1328760 RepID=A0A165F9B6_XYLHT|nr:hypothetical protein L228DRAFT_249534 [Xylona heveae TC161]KZF20729.1 hypothetical protein L228DRAFT_249534 [Xylona heveae TC161]
MVLCPFVFLITRPDVPPLKLQQSEVASAHWVSLRALLAPSQRTVERCDVSDRLIRQSGHLTRAFFRAMLGQMVFAAVRLRPTESLYSSRAPGFLPSYDGCDEGDTIVPGAVEGRHDSHDETKSQAAARGRAVGQISAEPPTPTLSTSPSRALAKRPLLTTLKEWWLGDHAGSANMDRPLLLWGLTLGVLADFLELLPPHDALGLWSYPTFTPWDVRFTIRVMTFFFRRRKQCELEEEQRLARSEQVTKQSGGGNEEQNMAVGQTKDIDSAETMESAAALSEPPAVAVEEGLDAVGLVRRSEGGITQNVRERSWHRPRSSAVGVLLDGYYTYVRRSVALALLGRFTFLGLILVHLFRRWQKQ